MLTIVVHPDYGHPSSLWPSRELVTESVGAHVLPNALGMDEILGEEILAWTGDFQKFFVKQTDDFDSRPQWRAGINPFEWYDEGYRIVQKIRSAFPHVHVKPQFAQYVFSINERRENLGLPPIRLPHEAKTGYISVTDVSSSDPATDPPAI